MVYFSNRVFLVVVVLLQIFLLLLSFLCVLCFCVSLFSRVSSPPVRFSDNY